MKGFSSQLSNSAPDCSPEFLWLCLKIRNHSFKSFIISKKQKHRKTVLLFFGAEEGTWTLMNLHSLEPESSASAIPPLPRILFIAAFCQQMYVNTSALKSQSDYTIIFSLNYTMVKRMKKAILIFLCVFAFIFTVWYMQFGGLTENSGALSKTGLIHPVDRKSVV